DGTFRVLLAAEDHDLGEVLRRRRPRGGYGGRQLMAPARTRAHAAPKFLLVLACVVALGGGSTVKGWFTDKSKNIAEPSELVDFTPTAKPQRMWSVNVGKGEGRLGSRQAPAIADGRVYAADLEGGVGAWDLQSGKPAW